MQPAALYCGCNEPCAHRPPSTASHCPLRRSRPQVHLNAPGAESARQHARVPAKSMPTIETGVRLLRISWRCFRPALHLLMRLRVPASCPWGTARLTFRDFLFVWPAAATCSCAYFVKGHHDRLCICNACRQAVRPTVAVQCVPIMVWGHGEALVWLRSRQGTSPDSLGRRSKG